MQYAFYQVIAAATMFVMGNLVIYVLTQPPFLPVPDPASLLTLLIVVFLGGVYALLKVPALTSHIFSGMSGLSSGAIIELLPVMSDQRFQRSETALSGEVWRRDCHQQLSQDRRCLALSGCHRSSRC